ncbi:hypothetical protein RB597_009807 [Gaeumannomyces tritici]
MEGSPPPPPGPGLLERTLSADFFKNYLAQSHPAFASLPDRYDPAMSAMTPQHLKAPTGSHGGDRWTEGSAGATPPRSSDGVAPRLTPRKLVPAVRAMEFWARILDESVKKFKEDNSHAPGKLAEKPEYGIRDVESWDAVLDRLQAAREKFDGNKSEFLANVKHAYRWLFDCSDAINKGIEYIPDSDYVTPVKAGLTVLIEAAKTTSEVRAKVTHSFEEGDLREKFGKIEIFLATFPGDENIRLACIDMVACTLKAIELAIAYYVSRALARLRKAMPVIGDGRSFQENLITAIDQIRVECDKIVEKALESHIAGTKKAMELALEGIDNLAELLAPMGTKLEAIDEKLGAMDEKNDRVIEQTGQLLANSEKSTKRIEELAELIKFHVVDMFNQGAQKKNLEMDAKEEENKKAIKALERKCELIEIEIHLTKEENERLRAGQTILSSITPPLPQQQLAWYPPAQAPWQTQPAPQAWSQPQPQYPYQQQARYPPWTPFEGMAYHPLLSPPQGYAYPPPPPPEPPLHLSTLLTILGASSPDASDIASILESAESIGQRYRSRAKRIITADEFRSWATSPASCALLIQGDMRYEMTQAGAALSFVCASLVQSLRNQPSLFVPVVFFCRQHLESDDAFFGPTAMVRALIAQLLLLQQQQQGQNFLIDAMKNAPFTQRDLELAIADPALQALRYGNIDALCRLLEWLARHALPQRKTLVCVLDGVEVYETSRHEGDLGRVVQCLLGLARDTSLGTSVKVLATSPEGTVSLDENFDDVVELQALESRGDEDSIAEIEDELQ